jgi:hypothetical protein
LEQTLTECGREDGPNPPFDLSNYGFEASDLGLSSLNGTIDGKLLGIGQREFIRQPLVNSNKGSHCPVIVLVIRAQTVRPSPIVQEWLPSVPEFTATMRNSKPQVQVFCIAKIRIETTNFP